MSAYQLVLGNKLLGHYGRAIKTVQDADEASTQRLYVEMQVRSGDYFVTLATRMDGIAHQIHGYDEVLAAEIDDVVSELLYLQRSYQIVKA